MAGSSISITAHEKPFAPAWLPPGGRGNGLTAGSWAQIADLDARRVTAILEMLRSAAVPAYAAPAPRPVRPLTPRTPPRGTTWRLWVGATSYCRAEHVLLRALAEIGATEAIGGMR